MYITCSWIYK